MAWVWELQRRARHQTNPWFMARSMCRRSRIRPEDSVQPKAHRSKILPQRLRARIRPYWPNRIPITSRWPRPWHSHFLHCRWLDIKKRQFLRFRHWHCSRRCTKSSVSNVQDLLVQGFARKVQWVRYNGCVRRGFEWWCECDFSINRSTTTVGAVLRFSHRDWVISCTGDWGGGGVLGGEWRARWVLGTECGTVVDLRCRRYNWPTVSDGDQDTKYFLPGMCFILCMDAREVC